MRPEEVKLAASWCFVPKRRVCEAPMPRLCCAPRGTHHARHGDDAENTASCREPPRTWRDHALHIIGAIRLEPENVLELPPKGYLRGSGNCSMTHAHPLAQTTFLSAFLTI